MTAGVEEPNGSADAGPGGPARAQHSRDHDGPRRRHRRGDAERLALGPLRSAGGQLARRPAARGRLLLQDLHGADARRLDVLRALHPARRRPRQGTFEPDPDRYEGRHDFADVLVIGGGPAGLAAAIAAGRTGARVTLVEQDALLGGSLLAEPVGGAGRCVARRARRRAGIAAATSACSRARRRPGSMTATPSCWSSGATISRPDPAKGEARQVAVTLRAKAIVFAAGALERPLVFNNNDRPGVMLAGAVRTYLNRFAVSPGRRAVVATNNDSAYRDRLRSGAGGPRRRRRRSAPGCRRRHCARAPRRPASSCARAPPSSTWPAAAASTAPCWPRSAATTRRRWRAATSSACPAAGRRRVHLTSHTGIKPRYDAAIAAFVPGGFAAGQFGAGAVIGSFGFVEAVRGGFEAGRRAAAHAGHDAPASELPLPDLRAQSAMPSSRSGRSAPRRGGKAFVDFQNDVTAKDVQLAHREGYQSVEHLKRYTTLGMGTDQGKTSQHQRARDHGGPARRRHLRRPARRPSGRPIRRSPSARSPGAASAHHFRPIRRSPLHDWHIANGGEMIEAGPWLRAWYYRWAGDTPASRLCRGDEAGAQGRRARRRLDARQDRRAGAGRRRVPQPRLCQRLRQAAGRQGALRRHAERRRPRARRRHDDAALGDALLHDHDDGAGRRGHVLARVPAADGLDRSARACQLAQRRMGGHGGVGPEGARGAGARLPRP